MKKTELFFNLLLGFSIISWGFLGLFFKFNDLDNFVIRGFTAAINFTVGFLILFRKPLEKDGNLKSILISLTSLIFGGLIFKFASPYSQLPFYIELIFALGALFTILTFIFLGKNFSILPSLRKISKKGTYSLVRHPAYLGEITMFFACTLSNIKIITVIFFIILIPSIILRIEQEEKILSQLADYQEYKKQVKWKLIPFLW